MHKEMNQIHKHKNDNFQKFANHLAIVVSRIKKDSCDLLASEGKASHLF